MDKYLKKIRTIADFQFGKGVGKSLFPDEVDIELGSTKKIRRIYLNSKLIASLRPSDGFFTLSFYGAERLHELLPDLRYHVKVKREAVPFVAQGMNVLSNQISFADEEILPKEEVIVIDEFGKVIAVGEAILNGKEMYEFNYGLAIKVRKSFKDKIKSEGLWDSKWNEEKKREMIMQFLTKF